MKGNRMKDKDLFHKIEQFDDYPIGYESNLSTQQQLIVDSVNSPISNFQSLKNINFKYSIAIFSAVLVTIIIYFSMYPTKHAFKQPMQVTSMHREIGEETPMIVSGIKSAKAIAKRSNAIELDTAVSIMDTGKNIVYQSTVLALQTDTIVPQKEIAQKEQPKLFAKRQRIKQFDFESKVNPLPAESSGKKMEYFVMKDGQFRIFSRNKNQMFINHF